MVGREQRPKYKFTVMMNFSIIGNGDGDGGDFGILV